MGIVFKCIIHIRKFQSQSSIVIILEILLLFGNETIQRGKQMDYTVNSAIDFCIITGRNQSSVEWKSETFYSKKKCLFVLPGLSLFKMYKFIDRCLSILLY